MSEEPIVEFVGQPTLSENHNSRLSNGLQINRYRTIDDAFRGHVQRLFARGEADVDMTMSASACHKA